MKPTIAVFRTLSDELTEQLLQHCEIIDARSLDDLTDEQAQRIVGILAYGGFHIKRDQLTRFPSLRVVSTISVGYDSYDVDALTERGVLLTHTPNVLDETVADTVLALMLSSARRVVELANWVRSGQWQSSLKSDKFGIDVHHKTLGIIGLGRVGLAVAKRAHWGFSMPILYTNRHDNSDAEQQVGAQRVSLQQLLAESDFIVVLAPLTSETYHLLGAYEFNQMKSSVIFVNAARGDVVDEQALIKALENKQIQGAGLDVFHQEPLGEQSPLFRFDQVVTLPHIGSATEQTREAMAQLAVANLLRVLLDKPLENCVNLKAYQH